MVDFKRKLYAFLSSRRKDRAAGAGIFGQDEVLQLTEDPRSGGPVLSSG